ncbi:hypothetical protein PLUTE_a3914 [Pseudoalteromonas luteoviolacea DSM 6061]|nr:hypothetical protein [Pseudoalteromonas luteoviolacea DSM 6061]
MLDLIRQQGLRIEKTYAPIDTAKDARSIANTPWACVLNTF